MESNWISMNSQKIFSLISNTPFYFIALLSTPYLLYKIPYNIFFKYLHRSKGRLDPSTLGKYAIVTGASDGIGKAISIELALLGFDLVLVGRSESKLASASAEIRSLANNHGKLITIQNLIIDFDAPLSSLSEYLDCNLKNLDIGLLVNNVGISYPSAQYFNEVPETFIDTLINVNLRSTLLMSHWVFKKLVAKKCGMIVCIGSGASELPSSPLYTAYASVKSAIESFCRSLQVEATSNNICVQCQTPLLVTTKLSKVKKTSISIPSTKRYAKAAINSMNESFPAFSGSTVCPYWFHKIQLIISNISPTFGSWFIFKEHMRLRKRALKHNNK